MKNVKRQNLQYCRMMKIKRGNVLSGTGRKCSVFGYFKVYVKKNKNAQTLCNKIFLSVHSHSGMCWKPMCLTLVLDFVMNQNLMAVEEALPHLEGEAVSLSLHRLIWQMACCVALMRPVENN